MAIAKGRTSTASSTPALKTGDPAPDFSLKRHNGDEPWALSEQRGKNVVLAFYPFAFTPV
jgi:peroxiredoxin